MTHKVRAHRINASIFAGLFSKAIQMVVSVVMVPLLYQAFGAELYGVWVAVSTILLWVALMDLGIGNGLVNGLSQALARNSNDTASALVTNAGVMLSAVGLILFVVLSLILQSFDIVEFFDLDVDSLNQVLPYLWSAVLLFSILIPASLSKFVLRGMQKSYISDWIISGTSIFSLAFVYLLINKGWIFLNSALWVTTGASTISYIVLIFLLHRVSDGLIRWKWRKVSRKVISSLYKAGMGFFVIQGVVLLVYQFDILLITYFLGAKEVAQYAIPYRLFMYASVLVGIIIAPIWAAYSDAAAKDDWIWIRTTHKRNKCFLLPAGMAIIFIIWAFSKEILEMWVDSSVIPEGMVLVLLALFFALRIWVDIHSVLLNGLNQIREQIKITIAQAIFSFTVSVILIQGMGLVGLCIGQLLGLGLTSAIFLPRLSSRVLARQKFNSAAG